MGGVEAATAAEFGVAAAVASKTIRVAVLAAMVAAVIQQQHFPQHRQFSQSQQFAQQQGSSNNAISSRCNSSDISRDISSPLSTPGCAVYHRSV